MAKIGASTQQFIALFDKKRKLRLNFKQRFINLTFFTHISDEKALENCILEVLNKVAHDFGRHNQILLVC